MTREFEVGFAEELNLEGPLANARMRGGGGRGRSGRGKDKDHKRDRSIHEAVYGFEINSVAGLEPRGANSTPDETTLPGILESLRKLTGFVPPGTEEKPSSTRTTGNAGKKR